MGKITEGHQLERRTVLQSHSAEWVEKRRKRISASNSGRICKRRPWTSCKKRVQELLYGQNICTSSMKYGQCHEDPAFQAVMEITKSGISKCGFFIDSNLQYLAASPNGIVDDGHGIIEI